MNVGRTVDEILKILKSCQSNFEQCRIELAAGCFFDRINRINRTE